MFLIFASGTPTSHAAQKLMTYNSADSLYSVIVQNGGANGLQVWSVNGKIYQVIYGERDVEYDDSRGWHLFPGVILTRIQESPNTDLPVQHYISLLGCKGKGRPTVYDRQTDRVHVFKKYSNCEEAIVKSVAGRVLYTRLERTDIRHVIWLNVPRSL
jgi:hypothetical protein